LKVNRELLYIFYDKVEFDQDTWQILVQYKDLHELISFTFEILVASRF